MKQYKFQNKTVLITGAAGGLGKALCDRFGQAGATIAAIDIHKINLDILSIHLTARKIPHICLKVDVTRASECKTAINKIIQEVGEINILVNNAGITHLNLFEDTDLKNIEKVMNVNFFGAVYCAKAALNSLISTKGQIINIASVAGFAPLLGRAGYVASKHAMKGFFETLRVELQDKGVSVLMVCPATVDTPIRKNASNSSRNSERFATGKSASPEAVADDIAKAAAQNKRLLLTGMDSKLAHIVSKISPRLYDFLMHRRVASRDNSCKDNS